MVCIMDTWRGVRISLLCALRRLYGLNYRYVERRPYSLYFGHVEMRLYGLYYRDMGGAYIYPYRLAFRRLNILYYKRVELSIWTVLQAC